jgi:hypothetical protein
VLVVLAVVAVAVILLKGQREARGEKPDEETVVAAAPLVVEDEALTVTADG